MIARRALGIIVALMLAALAWVGLRKSPAVTAVSATGLVLGVWLLSYGLFAKYQFWMAPLFPAVALGAVYASSVLLGYASSRRRALSTRISSTARAGVCPVSAR